MSTIMKEITSTSKQVVIGLQRNSPTMKIQALSDFVRGEFDIEVPKQTLYKAKNIALYGIQKKHVEEFKVLRKYVAQVYKTNLGSFLRLRKLLTTKEKHQDFRECS